VRVAALLIAPLSLALQEPVARVSDHGTYLLVEYGPIRLPARTTHHQLDQPPTLTIRLPVDGWLRGMEVALVDGRGREVPRRLLHHMNVISPDSRDLFSDVMLRVVAAGAETAPVILPRFIGLRVHRGDSLFVTIMFHNPS